MQNLDLDEREHKQFLEEVKKMLRERSKSKNAPSRRENANGAPVKTDKNQTENENVEENTNKITTTSKDELNDMNVVTTTESSEDFVQEISFGMVNHFIDSPLTFF